MLGLHIYFFINFATESSHLSRTLRKITFLLLDRCVLKKETKLIPTSLGPIYNCRTNITSRLIDIVFVLYRGAFPHFQNRFRSILVRDSLTQPENSAAESVSGEKGELSVGKKERRKQKKSVGEGGGGGLGKSKLINMHDAADSLQDR